MAEFGEGVRYEWTGLNLGSITLTSAPSGRQYRVGLNMEDRFVLIDPADVAWAASIDTFQPAPLEAVPLAEPPVEPAPKSKAQRAAKAVESAITPVEPESDAPPA